jgi:hypothetical protein
MNDNWRDQLLKQLIKDVRTNADNNCTINAKYKISIGRAKKKFKRENCMKAKGDCPD